eukprot:CAMPEP_0202689272 /NCGR_PEP_ID=MMETSP1385-20130828/4570_1 /ASSEMBLY_ACC=CAM_ASM_000861 /TAXON_ID=933848 /ORGANISM="Elphidium margaritaceum" /LENGTH=1069 /DNA_ID=CAMNT_0049344383 /DNA_START=42 /DNA_END=3251 /DNA_ORIENTATION=+
MPQREEMLHLLDALVNGKSNDDIQTAHNKLLTASQNNGYVVSLLSVFCDASATTNPFVRQQSGILLKNFIVDNWEKNGVLNETQRMSLKQSICSEALLSDANSKIRETTALIISYLAEYDYPEKWPNLLDIILSSINTACTQRNMLLLCGSITTLKQFIEHISHLQLPQIMPVLIPLIYSILSEQSIQNVQIRLDLLSIYQFLLSLCAETNYKQIHPSAASILNFINFHILGVKRQEFIDLQVLSISILCDVLKTKVFLKQLPLPNLQKLLVSVWDLMLFYSDRVSVHDAAADEQLLDALNTFYSVSFDLFAIVFKHKKSGISTMLDDKLNDICTLVLKLLVLGDDDRYSFEHSPNEFLMHEENVNFANSVRSTVRNVMLSILDIRPRTGYYALLQTAKKQQHEANVLVFGYLAPHYQTHKKSGDLKMEQFLQKIIGGDHGSDPMLIYRILWTLHKFISSLNMTAKQQICGKVLNCMKADNPICIRYQAVKCFESLLLSLSNDAAQHDEQLSAVRAMLNETLPCVMPLICQLLTSLNDLTMSYILRSLASIVNTVHVIQVDRNNNNNNNSSCSSSKFAFEIVSLLIKLWPSYYLNQDIMFEVKHLIKICVTHSYADDRRNLNNIVLPMVLDILKNRSSKECDDCVVHNALQILHILVADLAQKGEHDQISRVYYEQFLPLVLQLLLSAENTGNDNDSDSDSDIIKEALRILCVLINHNPQLIVSGKLGDTPFVQHICRIISRFLSLQMDDDASLGIASLISQLVINLKCALNDTLFTDLLMTIVAKMESCRLRSLKNELLLIFPRLMHQYDAVQIVQFLANHHKLQQVMVLWCANHGDFIYPYYKKLSVMALAKLLSTSVANQSVYALLQNLSFDGYAIIDVHAPRVSRSRKQTIKFTQMPFIVKFFQILVDTFRDLVDVENEFDDVDDYDDDDDDDDDEFDETETEVDEDDDDEYEPTAEDEQADESDDEDESEYGCDEEQLLPTSADHAVLKRGKNKPRKSKSNGAVCDSELEQCPEAKKDPIYDMNFEQWSKTFAKQIAQQNAQAFQGIISMLNEKDRSILQHILK